MRFRATIELGRKTATGLEVPAEVVTAIGPSKRPTVRVTVGNHTYRSTIATISGRFLLPLSTENRASAGVNARPPIDDECAPNLSISPAVIRRPVEEAPTGSRSIPHSAGPEAQSMKEERHRCGS